jgi:hypothetical protein
MLPQGRILYKTDTWWVIDFGVPAFDNTKPPKHLKVGDFVNGDIYLGMDTKFFCINEDYPSDAPALIADWRIDRIHLETALFIERGKLRMRDESMRTYRDITETDGWNDDGGHREYVLTCTRLDRPLRRSR